MTDASLHVIAGLLLPPQAAGLSTLDLSYTEVTDAGLAVLASACGRGLRDVDVSWCSPGVTDAGICHLARGCANSLVKIGFSANLYITDRCILEGLSEHCPQLEVVSAARCPRVTQAALDHLRTRCGHLKTINAWGSAQTVAA